MAASLRDPGLIPGGGPKRFHDSFNFVFFIVGECISCAAETHLQSLFQRLSICLLRGNAALFNNRCPPDQMVAGDELEW